MKNARNPIDLMVMQTALRDYRQSNGKETEPRHYSNEIGLIRFAITGNCKTPIDFKNLSGKELLIADSVIRYNGLLLKEKYCYQIRKQACRNLALELQSTT
jgi:hypothetical protein